MSALLHFVCRMVEEPPTMFGINDSGGSLVFGIAESLLSIFTFRKSHQDFLSSNDLPVAFKEHYPLANQSLLLILILTNHCTATTKNNKYRQSLFGCCDSKGEHNFCFVQITPSTSFHNILQIIFGNKFQWTRRKRDIHLKSTSQLYLIHCAKL